jgi:hypothetical protein
VKRSSRHAAVLAAQDAVLRAAVGDLRDVVGEDTLEEVERLRAARLDLAHVGDVEDARGPPDGQVLLADPRVLDGHLPAGERDELGPGREVASVQRGALEGL